MDTYDYRQETGYINEIGTKIDKLSESQAKQVSEFIDRLNETSEQGQISQSLEWLDSVLSALQEFAEMTYSLLTIERSNNSIVVTTLTNENGFDITENCRLMRMVIGLSNHIAINSKESETSLVLIFDCARLAG